jgi:hypothetical protein
MRKLILPFVLAALILLIVGCPSPSNSGNSTSGGSKGGSLTINLPMIPLQVAKQRDPNVTAFYDVSGSGPGNARFLRSGITDTSVTIDSLAPGDWAVTVNGNSFGGVQVESASLLVTVVEGETASHDVVVSQVVGKGNLDMSLEWPVSRNISSAIVSLTPQGGVPFAINLSSAVTTGVVSSISATAEVPAGYYTLSRVFYDGTGGADAVQITSGGTTKFALSVVSGINLTITPDISKVIPITFDGYKATLAWGSVMTITAKPAVLKVSYQWYLNGALLDGETGNSIIITAKDHLPGSYRLDCVVAAKGVLSSDYVSLSITGN